MAEGYKRVFPPLRRKVRKVFSLSVFQYFSFFSDAAQTQSSQIREAAKAEKKNQEKGFAIPLFQGEKFLASSYLR